MKYMEMFYNYMNSIIWVYNMLKEFLYMEKKIF